ncbi:TetR family transcriptional regulator [Acidiferrimicrobium sp. IK]|uniref:TetR/AcrR family transcriptional regulator n=1 Tax=Acidiferrimicrobium sp. IK TaxID=2871700 RepID=UPI0021CB9044|nr:TetR family transcriptional regulator [Acidiferrimicrobium sp. IK]MCU4183000.1 TetR family transcriptional regulator [Acidiferrimicrobium sp. IK]
MVGGLRSHLVDVAERLAATRGIGAMTLRDVQQESGQRNKSVVQYYFGSREGLIAAVMDARMGPINLRRNELLAEIGPEPDLRDLVGAFVVPLGEVTVLAATSYWGRFLLQASFDPAFRDLVRASLTASSFRSVRAALIRQLTGVPRSAQTRRVDMMVEFVLVAIASAEEERDGGRLGAAAASRFVADLVDMCCGLLTAPPSWAVASKVRTGDDARRP